jgi:hypothetical protein
MRHTCSKYRFMHAIYGIYCILHGICLKVPKCEIFITELYTLSDPIWVGDLGSEAKHQFFESLKADVFHFLFLTMTDSSATIIPRILSGR